MTHLITRIGVPLDLEALYELAKPYAAESLYGKHYGICEKTAKATFLGALEREDFYRVYLSEVGDELVGAAIISFNGSFFNGIEGDVEFFYVKPEYRRVGVSRELVKSCVEFAHQKKLNVLHTGCHSGFKDGGKNDRLFSNLFKKFGFEHTGHNLHYIPESE